MIVSRSEEVGSHPNSRRIFPALASDAGASPGRRGHSRTGIGHPVTRRAISITSRLVAPRSLPML